MKTVRLNGVRPPRNPKGDYTEHRYWTVHLGNRNTLMFTSERAAQAFQAETDRWISSHLHDCNFLLAEAFTAYRLGWLLLDRCKVHQGEHRARQLVETAWKSMDLAILKCSGPNGWMFGWSYLLAAVQAVHELAILLRDLHLSRNNPPERARMELLAKRAGIILDDMRGYGATAKGAVKLVQL